MVWFVLKPGKIIHNAIQDHSQLVGCPISIFAAGTETTIFYRQQQLAQVLWRLRKCTNIYCLPGKPIASVRANTVTHAFPGRSRGGRGQRSPLVAGRRPRWPRRGRPTLAAGRSGRTRDQTAVATSGWRNKGNCDQNCDWTTLTKFI